MSASANHGAGTRRPVVYGGRREPGLYERDRKDGSKAYDYNVRIDGRMTRGTIKGALTVTDAVREFRRLLSDRDYGREHESPLLNPTVAEVLDEWLAALQARVGIRDEKRRLAPTTVRNYEGRVRLHVKPVLGRLRVADVAVRDLRKLISYSEARGFAPAHVLLILRTMSGALGFAFDNGYTARNVARDLPRGACPGSKRLSEPRYLTRAEVETLLGAAPDKYRPVWACCAYAALRIGEALGLQWECIDFRADTITIRQQYGVVEHAIVPRTKTKSSAATLPMLPALKAELLAHRSRMASLDLQRVRPEAPVFVGAQTGQLISPNMSLRALQRLANRVGLNPPGAEPIGQHDLRHSCAALALAAGAGPEEVCELMRHASPHITMTTYAGLNADSRGAAARKLLDAGFGA